VVVAYLVANKKISSPLVVAWNLACFALLVNIVANRNSIHAYAVQVFMNEPANTIVAKFPIVMAASFVSTPRLRTAVPFSEAVLEEMRMR
jgi:hypothetical protein